MPHIKDPTAAIMMPPVIHWFTVRKTESSIIVLLVFSV
jgi:hypothetical protein